MKLSVIIPVFNQEVLIIKALQSIPPRKDIEIIVIDDCSTDNTLQAVRQYHMNSLQDIVVLHNEENEGVGYTINRGLDYASGEYIVLLGSDDYFTQGFNEVIEMLDCDLVYFDLELNNGDIIHINEETKRGYCGSVKFMRKDFIGDTRNPNIRQGEDYYFYQELLKKNPSERFTGIVAKHYNFPRVNSLTWEAMNKKEQLEQTEEIMLDLPLPRVVERKKK